jgi:hypothetical protein
MNNASNSIADSEVARVVLADLVDNAGVVAPNDSTSWTKKINVRAIGWVQSDSFDLND